MHQDFGDVEVVPAQPHPLAPVCRKFLLQISILPKHFVQEGQNNHEGFYGHGHGAYQGAYLHAVDPPEAPPEAFPDVQPHAAPLADMPPPNGLRNLASRFLNNPDTLVNMLRIEPGPGDRFVVWIELELADI